MRLVITKSCVWVKSCILKTLRERVSIMDLIRSILQKQWAFWGICWEWVCKYQIALQLMSSKIAQYISLWVISLLCASFFFLSSLCCYKIITLCPSNVSLSFLLSSVENLLPLLLLSSSSSTGIPLYFFFYLSNLIWEIHFEGRVLINKTPSNTNLLPKTPRYHRSCFIYIYMCVCVWGGGAIDPMCSKSIGRGQAQNLVSYVQTAKERARPNIQSEDKRISEDDQERKIWKLHSEEK